MAHEIPAKALVVVADAGKAILFRNTGVGHVLELHEERRLTPDTAVEQGPSGARPADQSLSQTHGASFVNTLAHVLQGMHGKNEFSALFLVAAPKTLGELRSALHKSVEGAVVGSLSKDLTNQPLAEIQKTLSH